MEVSQHERRRRIEEELFPTLTPAERQVYQGPMVDYISGYIESFEQMKANIAHIKGCHILSGAQLANASPREQALHVLGLSGNPSDEQIRAAYWRLSRLHHPDMPNGDAELMAKINAAYAELTKQR